MRAARERFRTAGITEIEWQDDGRFVRVQVADPATSFSHSRQDSASRQGRRWRSRVGRPAWTQSYDPLVARPLELVKTGPMCWEFRRLEHVDHHVLARAVQDDSGKAVVGSPPGIDESAANVAAEPTTVERAHVMVIRTARSQRSIRGEPVFSGQCAWVDHADILTSVPGPRPHAVWESASRRGGNGTEP